MATSRRKRGRTRTSGTAKPARSTRQNRALYEAGVFTPLLETMRKTIARCPALRDLPAQLPGQKKKGA